MNRIPDFYAIIPAGGAGTRLWPLSRAGKPKFLLDLTGAGKTLLQQTVERLAPLASGVVVVTGKAHEEACRTQLPDLPEADFLAEPSPRNSMAAIGLAAAVLQQRHGEVIVGSFAADHVITGTPEFADVVAQAVNTARAGYVATIGITASSPATGFGYIESGEPVGIPDAPTARHVLGFTEKPDAATARQYLDAGNYFWNAGMFVSRTNVLLDHLAALRPELAAGLRTIARDWDTPRRTETLNRVWPTLEKIAIDYAIAEPVAALGGMAVVPASFTWHDIGDFATLTELLPPANGTINKVLGTGDIIELESSGNLVVPGGKRVIALVGLSGIAVVDTPDALLISSIEHAQEVGQVVTQLSKSGLTHLL
ncbi:MAG: sugar phosphate nucleotidyltransferase [Promicromonosporaceae bacterium]|nr:sugar phosphate nucleotidyltransferase [Promicromonosporaceae bacterium]